jgi:hypothetical protein
MTNIIWQAFIAALGRIAPSVGIFRQKSFQVELLTQVFVLHFMLKQAPYASTTN